MDVGLNTQNLVAILVVIALSVINIFGVKTGALIQNIFTTAKFRRLLGLVLFGFFIGRNAQAVAANFGANFWNNSGSARCMLRLGLAGPIVIVGNFDHAGGRAGGFAILRRRLEQRHLHRRRSQKSQPQSSLISGAWNGRRDRALHRVQLYLSERVAFGGSPDGTTLLERGIQYAREDRVATAVMTQMFGSAGGGLMAVAIMISGFGCCNGLILSGARVYYAMAKDGLFFRSVAKLHPTYKTPAVSLMVQMVWTCVLCISGSYGQLLDYIIFAVLVFYMLTIVGLFVLRRTHPEAERPYELSDIRCCPQSIL